jgi:hypothetical protein
MAALLSTPSAALYSAAAAKSTTWPQVGIIPAVNGSGEKPASHLTADEQRL